MKIVSKSNTITGPGKLVEHLKKNKRGRTYDKKGLINNKIPVYFETGNNKYSTKAILCNFEDLRVYGYID